MICWDLGQDDTSQLHKAMHAGTLPLRDRVAMDQANLTYLQVITARQAAGDKSARFKPLYIYPGGPWQDDSVTQKIEPDGGYVRMTTEECDAWLADLRARQLARAA